MTRRWMARALAVSAIGCVLACAKGRADPPAEANPATSAARSDAAADRGGTALPNPSGTAQPATGWQGSYKSVQGTMYIPPDWKDVHWKLKESDVGLGDGAIAMRVDGATGRASGTLDGPLGPATFEGIVSNGKVTAAIARKDPTDQGFTGTLIGSLSSGRVEGTMNLSSAFVSAVRMATFAMAPEGGRAATP